MCFLLKIYLYFLTYSRIIGIGYLLSFKYTNFRSSSKLFIFQYIGTFLYLHASNSRILQPSCKLIHHVLDGKPGALNFEILEKVFTVDRNGAATFL
jgi:hypothetical protein